MLKTICLKDKCFACKDNICQILTDTTGFQGHCPFCKTKEQVMRERVESLVALVRNGRFDLIEKYNLLGNEEEEVEDDD